MTEGYEKLWRGFYEKLWRSMQTTPEIPEQTDEERMRDNRALALRRAAKGTTETWWSLTEEEREYWRREADKPEPDPPF